MLYLTKAKYKKFIKEFSMKTTTNIKYMLKDLFLSTIYQLLELKLYSILGFIIDIIIKIREIDIYKILNQILEK